MKNLHSPEAYGRVHNTLAVLMLISAVFSLAVLCAVLGFVAGGI